MMQSKHVRFLLWAVIGMVLLSVLTYLFRPRTIIVDIAQVVKGELQEIITDEAKTRVHDVYTLSAPVTGHLRRIAAEVGDPVERLTTIVAEIEPIDPDFLDPRSEAQAKADIKTAESALSLAQAEVDQSQAELDFALAEFDRMRELRVSNSVSARELDNSERTYKSALAVLATTQAGLQMRVYELERARALMLSPSTTQTQHGNCQCVNITAPVSGRILKVLNKSEGVVIAGTALLEIGNPKDLEIVVELLSFDAVKVEPSQVVNIKNWGGSQPLTGRVNRIEPIGFMKVSALGIEEQRVNVVVDITSEYNHWARLGHGYQVDVEIVLWNGSDVLSVPVTALFREQDKWAIFVVKEDVAYKQIISIGHKNAFNVEVITGLNEGDWYVSHPNNQITDNVKVSSRRDYIE
ncbi:MAG: HlyD family secretion protein [Oleiphilaceae bacterium]|jgi:HlyD family secretion protein